MLSRPTGSAFRSDRNRRQRISGAKRRDDVIARDGVEMLDDVIRLAFGSDLLLLLFPYFVSLMLLSDRIILSLVTGRL